MDPASSDFLDNLKLPAKILVKYENETTHGGIYTISSIVTKQSVVASVRYSGAPLMEKQLLEIYLDAPIEFEIIKLTKLEMQKLRVEAQRVFSRFSSTDLHRIVVNPADEIQSLLLHSMKEGCEKGIEILSPEPSYSKQFPEFLTIKQHTAIPEKKTKAAAAKRQDLRLSLVQECHSEKLTRKNNSINYGKLQSGLWTTKTLGCSCDDISQVKEESDDNEYDYVDMEVVKNMKREKQNVLKSENSTEIGLNVIGLKHSELTDSAIYAKENRIMLEGYSVQQVLNLLNQLQLSEHCKAFEKERITGSLLLDLDESILKEELGVNMKLHRLKLERVINGRDSLKALMASHLRYETYC